MKLISPSGLHIVLYQPEIPQNTGNIGRLCVGSGSILHLVKPLRFMLDERSLRRAGLDYWHDLELCLHDDLSEIYELFPHKRIFLCTTKTDRLYTSLSYQPGDVFVFGPESRGLPEDLLAAHPEQCVTIPMTDKLRSLNLANSVGIVLYEAIRQLG